MGCWWMVKTCGSILAGSPFRFMMDNEAHLSGRNSKPRIDAVEVAMSR